MYQKNKIKKSIIKTFVATTKAAFKKTTPTQKAGNLRSFFVLRQRLLTQRTSDCGSHLLTSTIQETRIFITLGQRHKIQSVFPLDDLPASLSTGLTMPSVVGGDVTVKVLTALQSLHLHHHPKHTCTQPYPVISKVFQQNVHGHTHKFPRFLGILT